MPRSKSLVLFDIDGTLLAGAGLHHRRSLIEGIRRLTGISTTLDGVATSGMLDRDLIASMLRSSGCSERRISIAMRKIMAECQNAYLGDCAINLRAHVCAGVVDTLAELKARGAALGVVSGNLSQIGWKKLEAAGLRSYFAIGAFAEDAKSRTRLALVAVRRARKQGLVDENCRVSLIGDHANDVLAAKSNAFQAIAVATGLSSIEALSREKPDILVRDLTELDLENVL